MASYTIISSNFCACMDLMHPQTGPSSYFIARYTASTLYIGRIFLNFIFEVSLVDKGFNDQKLAKFLASCIDSKAVK